MIFGLVAILCWPLLLCAVLAFPVLVARKNRRGLAILSAFLLGASVAGALFWQAARPPGLSHRDALRAGLTEEGLRQYGHPIEHWAEVAICFTTYAAVLGGALCAGVTLATLKIKARRKPA